MQLSKENAGLRLFNQLMKDKAIKVAWIKRLATADPASTNSKLAMYHLQFKIKNSDLWYYNFNSKDVHQIACTTGFWGTALLAWAEYNFHQVNDTHEVPAQKVWCNSHLKVKGKMLYIKNLAEAGISQITDFYDEENRSFYTYTQLVQKYPIEINFLEYAQLLSCIPSQWKILLRQLNPAVLDQSMYEHKIDILLANDKITKIGKVTKYRTQRG